MSLTLVSSPTSPYVRKAMVLRIEAGLQDRVKLHPVSTNALNTAPDARAANPLGRIPALMRDGDSTLFDSRVITRYLDELAGSILYPADHLWDVLTLEALADGMLDSAVSMAYEVKLRPENERSPAWVDAQWSKIEHGLDSLEKGLFSAMSVDLNMGQIAVACVLDYCDFRHGPRNWQATRPNLAAFQKSFATRPSMIETYPAE